jgi:hypothetical protein
LGAMVQTPIQQYDGHEEQEIDRGIEEHGV